MEIDEYDFYYKDRPVDIQPIDVLPRYEKSFWKLSVEEDSHLIYYQPFLRVDNIKYRGLIVPIIHREQTGYERVLKERIREVDGTTKVYELESTLNEFKEKHLKKKLL